MLTGILGLAASPAIVLAAQKAAVHPKNELAPVADAILTQGLQAQLPPHISTLLGISHERQCPVRQGVLRSATKIQGADVSISNPGDVVLFVVDQATQDQTLYLTSPAGTLRRVLSVKNGVGHVVKPRTADRDAFRNEKQFWETHLTMRH